MLNYSSGNEVLPWFSPKPLIKLMTSVIFDRRLIGFFCCLRQDRGNVYAIITCINIFVRNGSRKGF